MKREVRLKRQKLWMKILGYRHCFGNWNCNHTTHRYPNFNTRNCSHHKECAVLFDRLLREDKELAREVFDGKKEYFEVRKYV